MPACAQAAAKSGYRGSSFGTTVRSIEDAADKLTGLRVFDQSFVHKSTNGLCRYDGDIGYVNSTHAAQGILDPPSDLRSHGYGINRLGPNQSAV